MKRFERSNGLDTALYKNYLFLDCTQTTSQEDMDLPLLCSTGSKYGAHERRTGRRAGPTVDFTRDVVMKSKKKTSYPTRTASSDSLGCYVKAWKTLDAKHVMPRVVQMS